MKNRESTPSRSGRARNSLTSINTPIIAVIGFNLITLLVFVTAPVSWNTDNLLKLYALVLSCQVLILIGFQLGRNRGLLTPPRRRLLFSRGDRLMPWLVGIYLCTFLTGYAYRMGFSTFDVVGMSKLLVAGIVDRHLGYETALRGAGLGPTPWRVYFLISIFNQCFFIAGFLHWKKMNFRTRLLFGALVAVEAVFSLGRGTSFGVVSLVTTFVLSSLIWMRSRFGNLVLVFLLFLGSVALLSYNLYSRSGNVERAVELSEFGKSAIVVDHAALSLVPASLLPTYVNVVSYLGGGYYHTALAFDLEFKSTYLVGNNPALIGLASLCGLDVWERTYMHRLQAKKDVDELGTWHSAYTWYASDVSFYGVPFVLLGVAYLFGFSWARSVQGDFLSKIVFVILGNMLLFLFANNTYLSTVFYSFMFLLPLWVLTRLFGFLPGAPLKRPHSASIGASQQIQVNASTEALR